MRELRAGSYRAVPLLLAAAAGAYTAALAVCYVVEAAGVERHNVETAAYWFAALALLALFISRGSSITPRMPIDAGTVNTRVLPAILIGAMALAASLYARSLSLGLFSDDFVLIERATSGEVFAPGDWAYFRPIPLAIWAAVSAGGLNPVALHTFNLFQHGIHGVLVCLLARRLGLQLRTGVGAGILLVTFPAAVEAVAWPSGTFDLWLLTAGLAGALVVLSEWPSLIRGVALAVCALVGILSKETAIVLPVAWALVGWAGRKPARAMALTLLGPVLLASAFAVWRLSETMPAEYAEPLTRYQVKELGSRLFGAMFIPWSTDVVRNQPFLVSLYVLVTFALTFLSLAISSASPRLRRIFISMLLWMVASILPLYAIFAVSPDLQGARYVYMASAGWALALALGFEAVPSRFSIAPAAGIGLLCAAGAFGVQAHLEDWTRAAVVRERILTSAGQVLSMSGCRCEESTFRGLTDSVGGAYVFRNGFSAALRARREDCGDDPGRSVPRCAFRWQDGSFVRVEP